MVGGGNPTWGTGIIGVFACRGRKLIAPAAAKKAAEKEGAEGPGQPPRPRSVSSSSQGSCLRGDHPPVVRLARTSGQGGSGNDIFPRVLGS